MLGLLDEDLAWKIIAESKRVLATIGIDYLGARARKVLDENGVQRNSDGRYVLDERLVDQALEEAPSSFSIFDRDGNEAARFGGDAKGVNFTPGSSALYYFDYETGRARKPTTDDFVRFTRVSDALENLYACSTAFVPSDIAEELSDMWRLYLAILHSPKPCVTGAFSAEGLPPMAELLEAVRGGRKQLAEKPLAIFSVCPSSPLRFTEATSENLLDCAERSIPVELIGMPISGLVAPVTLVGTLIQHTAENLSGLVLSQLANPGAPLLWGGSPAVFDIRCGTTPLGAVESMMIAAGYVTIGKKLGLPTQCYMGSSDSKLVDYQCGFESAMGLMTAALSGADSVSGPGMFELENCQSAEKLVIDNEICGELRFLADGFREGEDFPSLSLFERLVKEKNLLIDSHTNRHRASQRCDPGTVVDRYDRKKWNKKGSSDVLERAHERVCDILSRDETGIAAGGLVETLRDIMKDRASRLDSGELPPDGCP